MRSVNVYTIEITNTSDTFIAKSAQYASFLAVGGDAEVEINGVTLEVKEDVPLNCPLIAGKYYSQITVTAGAGVTLTGYAFG